MLPVKERNYITFECQTLDASAVGCDEIVMVDHLKKKKILVGWPEKKFTSPWTISALSSSSCTSFEFDSSISIYLKVASFDLLLPNMSLAFPYPKLY